MGELDRGFARARHFNEFDLSPFAADLKRANHGSFQTAHAIYGRTDIRGYTEALACVGANLIFFHVYKGWLRGSRRDLLHPIARLLCGCCAAAPLMA